MTEKSSPENELIAVLKEQTAKYPEIQPQDMVKLIYQNEFGSGHFITDENECFERLKKEAAGTGIKEGQPLTEYIGNGICRVFLSSPEIKNYPLTELNADFIRLSKTRSGSRESFENKLSTVKERLSETGARFSAEEFEAYLETYRKAGCPSVSHSESYRKKYEPAYRLVSCK